MDSEQLSMFIPETEAEIISMAQVILEKATYERNSFNWNPILLDLGNQISEKTLLPALVNEAQIYNPNYDFIQNPSNIVIECSQRKLNEIDINPRYSIIRRFSFSDPVTKLLTAAYIDHKLNLMQSDNKTQHKLLMVEIQSILQNANEYPDDHHTRDQILTELIRKNDSENLRMFLFIGNDDPSMDFIQGSYQHIISSIKRVRANMRNIPLCIISLS